MSLKKFIKTSLDKRGFRVMPKREYSELIKGTESLYRKTIFKNLSKSNNLRIPLMSNLIGTGIHEGFYILNYLNQSLKLKGDVCEFGVAQGATSVLLANEISKTDKNIWLFDSFKGLPMPTEKDKLKDDIFNLGDMKKYKGTMANSINLVKNKLQKIRYPLNKVNIVNGYIEKTIKSSNLPKEVCFAYVDFDFYEPTNIVLEFLNKTLSKGGVIVVDDYDFFSTGIKSSVQEFLGKYKGKYKFLLPHENAGHFCILQKIK